jgi:hypothetical protein
MKASRIPAPLHELASGILCGNTIAQHRKILTTKVAPSKLLKAKGPKEPPNKSLKIKGNNERDVKNEGTSQ